MNRIYILTLLILIMQINVLAQSGYIEAYVPGSCTVFSIYTNNSSYFCSNEDYRKIPLNYWAVASTDSTYGGVYFGFDRGGAQGGVNEKGLAFDFMGLPNRVLKANEGLPGRGGIFTRIMMYCATVDDVKNYIRKHNWGGNISYQVHYSDKFGNAMVISAGTDSTLSITEKKPNEKYLLSTNFNLADTSNHFWDSYPCWRYIRANLLLSQITDSTESIIERLKYILNAVHIEGGIGNTLYSYIVGQKMSKIYVFYWHQFEEVAIIDVKNEIQKQTSRKPLESLFSDKAIKAASLESKYYKKHKID